MLAPCTVIDADPVPPKLFLCIAISKLAANDNAAEREFLKFDVVTTILLLLLLPDVDVHSTLVSDLQILLSAIELPNRIDIETSHAPKFFPVSEIIIDPVLAAFLGSITEFQCWSYENCSDEDPSTTPMVTTVRKSVFVDSLCGRTDILVSECH